MLSDIATDHCYDKGCSSTPPMSEEQLKAFLEKVKADTSLQEKLKAASDADAVVAIAKEAGFDISVDDLEKAESELSEDELGGLSGGFHVVEGSGSHHDSCIIGNSPTLPIFRSIPSGAIDQQRSQ